jgi:Fe-S-cluster containining protein
MKFRPLIPSEDQMQFVPWRQVADWRCVTCGDCCRLYGVVINFHEWLKIVKNFGVEQTVFGLDKLFIKRSDDGSCAFLCNRTNRYLCGLQHMKPKACQLWPFKVLSEPRFGYPREASYEYGGNELFVYVDSMCNGIRYGTPRSEFSHNTLREFVEIASGVRTGQTKTTGQIYLFDSHVDFGVFGRKGYL